MLYEFCHNQWVMENPIIDQKRLFVGLFMQVSDFVGAFRVIM